MKEYNGPIVINDSGKITIVAYKNGLEYSEELIINVTIASNSGNQSGESSNTNGSSTNTNAWKQTGSKDTSKDNSDTNNTEPKDNDNTNKPNNNNTNPGNNDNKPTTNENATNNNIMSMPLIITLVVCGIAALTLIFILIGRRRKKDEE